MTKFKKHFQISKKPFVIWEKSLKVFLIEKYLISDSYKNIS